MTDFNPSHLNRRDTDRLAAYRSNLDFYQGAHWTTTSRHRQLVFNYAKVSIDKATSFLMQGLGFACYPVADVASDSEAIKARVRRAEQLLHQVYEQNNLQQLDYETEIDTTILGDGCYKVIWDTDEKRIRITAPDVSGIYAWWLGDDTSRVWRVASRYTLTRDEISILYGQSIGKKQAAITELWTDKAFDLYLDNDLIESRPNPYGFIPFIIFPNVKQPKRFWGESDIPILVQPQRELNRALSQLSRILELSGNPIAVLENIASAEDIKVGILKNFDSGTYKAGVQLAGSLTTYFDGIGVAKNIPSSALVIGNCVIVAIPRGNPKDACIIATWPQGSPGGGSFLDLSDTPSSYSGQAGKYVKVNAIGNALEFGLIATKFTPKVVSSELWRRNLACNSSFEALINGTPTSTSVVYDNDVRENSLPQLDTYSQWGKVILHNITRGNSRKITNVNLTTNTITTEPSTDDWADNDIITIGSQTCDYKDGYTYSRWFDVDISAEVPSTAKAVMLYAWIRDESHFDAALQNYVGGHPFETYGPGKVFNLNADAAYQTVATIMVLPVVNQKICLHTGAYGAIPAAGLRVIFRLLGYWE